MVNGGSGSGGADVFDVRKVRRLVELMKEHDLAEVDLKQGDQRIRLRRGQDPLVAAASPAAAAPVAVAQPAPPATPSSAAEAPEEANIAYVTSPMVGTFYASANPESPSYVNVGDQVGPDTIVCILEAMKVFNEIPAECSGSVVSQLVENGDAIEFGQKLFKIQSD